jgi:hypothetical protein
MPVRNDKIQHKDYANYYNRFISSDWGFYEMNQTIANDPKRPCLPC